MPMFTHYCSRGHTFGSHFYKENVLQVYIQPFIGECPKHGNVWVEIHNVNTDKK